MPADPDRHTRDTERTESTRWGILQANDKQGQAGGEPTERAARPVKHQHASSVIFLQNPDRVPINGSPPLQ